MKITNFEDFLIDKHAEQYAGLDDEMGDNCNEWIADLDTQEIIDYAEEWGLGTVNEIFNYLNKK